MRIRQPLLSCMLFVAAVVLGLAGCSGGGSGGGTTPEGNYGTVAVTTDAGTGYAQKATYTVPAAVSVNYIKANFVKNNTAVPQVVEEIAFTQTAVNPPTWTLDLTASSNAFSTPLNGSYTMAVYAVASGQADALIGRYTVNLQIDGIGGGSGPPPPPW